MKLLIGLAALTASLGHVATARAAKPAMLILELDAKALPPDLAELFEKELRQEVESVAAPEMRVLPKPALDLEGMKLAAGCVQDGPDCLAVIGKTLGASKVFRASITGTLERSRASFSVLDVATGKQKAVTKDLVDVGRETVSELRVYAAEALGRKKKLPDGSIVLTVGSKIGKLEGAEILLDDKRADVGALATVPAGKHRVEVHQKGFETFIWVGAVRSGRSTQVAVTFEPSKAPAEPVAALATPPAPAGDADKSGSSANAASATPASTGAGADDEEEATPSAASSLRHERGVPPPITAEYEIEHPSPAPVFTFVLAGTSLIAGAVALVQGLRVKGIEDDLVAFCADDETSGACAGPNEDPEKVCLTRGADCDDARRAATIANIGWITAGTLAVSAIAAYMIESAGPSRSGVSATGGVMPSSDGASAFFELRY